MKKDEVIAILRAHQPELHRMGVKHAALFGSVARGEADAKSDIDIAIEIDPDTQKNMGVYDYVDIKLFIADLFSGDVDVVKRHKVKPSMIERIERDRIDAF
jgi:uncharacterized protein